MLRQGVDVTRSPHAFNNISHEWMNQSIIGEEHSLGGMACNNKISSFLQEHGEKSMNGISAKHYYCRYGVNHTRKYVCSRFTRRLFARFQKLILYANSYNNMFHIRTNSLHLRCLLVTHSRVVSFVQDAFQYTLWNPSRVSNFSSPHSLFHLPLARNHWMACEVWRPFALPSRQPSLSPWRPSLSHRGPFGPSP